MTSQNTCNDGVLINPAYYVVSIKDVHISKVGILWYLHIINDETKGRILNFHIGSDFIASLCKMFRVSVKSTKDNIPLDALLDVIKENSNYKVRIYVNQARALALAIMKIEHNPVNINSAQEVYEWLVECKYDVRDLIQDEFFTEFAIMNQNPFTVGSDNFNEYRGGSFVHVDHVGGGSIKVVSALEHSNSRNYAIINNKALCIYVPTKNKTLENILNEVADLMVAITESKKPEFYQIFDDQIRTSAVTPASIKECVTAGSILIDSGCAECTNLINLQKTLDHYQIASPDEKSEKWLASNPSHLTRLNLFHILAGAGICSSAELKRIYRELIGDFLFSSGDLEGMNSKMLFNEVEMDDFDSDIVSDIEDCRATDDTECREDDDIKSDFGD